MPYAVPMLTPERLRELLDYDPGSGLFKWKGCRRGRRSDVAGTRTSRGYNQLCIDGRSYRAARCAWLWMTGEWPVLLVDHINRDKADDRWVNLRLASAEQNNANKGLSKSNRSGFKGVSFVPRDGKWRAMWAGPRGKSQHKFLGLYDTPEAASEAYQSFVSKRFGVFAPTITETGNDCSSPVRRGAMD